MRFYADISSKMATAFLNIWVCWKWIQPIYVKDIGKIYSKGCAFWGNKIDAPSTLNFYVPNCSRDKLICIRILYHFSILMWCSSVKFSSVETSIGQWNLFPMITYVWKSHIIARHNADVIFTTILHIESLYWVSQRVCIRQKKWILLV